MLKKAADSHVRAKGDFTHKLSNEIKTIQQSFVDVIPAFTGKFGGLIFFDIPRIPNYVHRTLQGILKSSRKYFMLLECALQTWKTMPEDPYSHVWHVDWHLPTHFISSMSSCEEPGSFLFVRDACNCSEGKQCEMYGAS